LHSKYLNKDTLKAFGDFKIGKKVICTVKYADNLVLLPKEETVLWGMIDRPIETGICYGMEINVGKTKVMRISRQPSPVQITTGQRQTEKVEYFIYLHGMINDARCKCEIKSRNAMSKAAFNKKVLFTSKLDLNLRTKLVKCYIWSIALYGAGTWTLWKADQKYLDSFEMWCWRRIKIIWTDRVRNEEV
jgi:hypothetical protein